MGRIGLWFFFSLSSADTSPLDWASLLASSTISLPTAITFMSLELRTGS